MLSGQAQLWKRQGVSGCWEMLLSNFGITDWKDVTVLAFCRAFRNSTSPCLSSLSSPSLPFPLLYMQYSQSGKMSNHCFRKCLYYISMLLSPPPLLLFFFLPRRQCFWPLVIFVPHVLILQLKKPLFFPLCYCRSHPASSPSWFSLPCALLCMFRRDFCCERFSPSSNSETKSLMVDSKSSLFRLYYIVFQ